MIGADLSNDASIIFPFRIICTRPPQPRQRLKVSPRKFKEKLQPLFLLLLFSRLLQKQTISFRNLEWFNGSGWKETQLLIYG